MNENYELNLKSFFFLNKEKSTFVIKTDMKLNCKFSKSFEKYLSSSSAKGASRWLITHKKYIYVIHLFKLKNEIRNRRFLGLQVALFDNFN